MALLDDALAIASSALRFGRGSNRSAGLSRRREPEALLELYEFEACPFCRKVRERMTELDLDYVSRTVPRGSPKRARLRELGGKEQVPFLIDPNTGTKLYESDDIIAYLDRTYGGG